MKIIRILLISFFMSPLALASFTGEDFFTAKSVADEITNRWSPDEYIYVGVGRSPVLLVAVLEALEHQVFHFPISNIQNWNGDMIRYHFDQFIPERIVQSGKKLLFIDFMVGGSFRHLAIQLEDHFENNPTLDGRFDYALLSTSRNKEEQDWLQNRNWIDIKSHQVGDLGSAGSFYQMLDSSEYEDFAYYDEKFPEVHSEAEYDRMEKPIPNPAYTAYLREVRRRLTCDSLLSQNNEVSE